MNRLKRILIILAIAHGTTLSIEYQDQLNPDSLQGWLEGFGVFSPLLFILLYAVATVLFIPGSLLSLSGGALFGPVHGTLYNLTGATLGATIAFILARYVFSTWVERKSGQHLQKIQCGVKNEGWRFIAFVRLMPLLPFNLLNYILGITRISLLTNVIISFICMAPATLAFTYTGYVGREVLLGGDNLIQEGMIALTVIAAVLFLPRLIKDFRSEKTILASEVIQMIDSGENISVVAIDEEPDTYTLSNYQSAILNVLKDEIPIRLHQLEPLRSHLIAILSKDFNDAEDAALQLSRLGFPQVIVIDRRLTRR